MIRVYNLETSGRLSPLYPIIYPTLETPHGAQRLSMADLRKVSL